MKFGDHARAAGEFLRVRQSCLFGVLRRFHGLAVVTNDLRPALPSFISGRLERVNTMEKRCRSLPEGGNVRNQAFHGHLMAMSGDHTFTTASNRTPRGELRLLDLRDTYTVESDLL